MDRFYRISSCEVCGCDCDGRLCFGCSEDERQQREAYEEDHHADNLAATNEYYYRVEAGIRYDGGGEPI